MPARVLLHIHPRVLRRRPAAMRDGICGAGGRAEQVNLLQLVELVMITGRSITSDADSRSIRS